MGTTSSWLQAASRSNPYQPARAKSLPRPERRRLWGAAATTIPLVLGMFIAKYLFRFHDALTLGIISGARTTTASLGLVCDQAKSQIPALGYTVTYAVGNTLLTIWGMIIIMLLS